MKPVYEYTVPPPTHVQTYSRRYIHRYIHRRAPHHVDGPNVFPVTNVRSGVPSASAVFVYTVLPHHVWIVSFPIAPLSGYCRLAGTKGKGDGGSGRIETKVARRTHQKKMMSVPTA